ncbi:hypothetical protein CFAEC_04770 [Corynebacterium faecale]|uniref:hypothetical protein n=1 Tax=Corynebacterium faecale TaxID=1758466 RepID=UPI0025B329E3|nr:hypothetical protein [Corynebacterium faecale]WJY91800.1 hypothetical protein CFAEC_04770 [Corynebacterium faecale]
MSTTPNTNPFGTPEDEDDRVAKTGTSEDKDTVPTGGPTTDDEKVDEWGEESFPSSDPPANY